MCEVTSLFSREVLFLPHLPTRVSLAVLLSSFNCKPIRAGSLAPGCLWSTTADLSSCLEIIKHNIFLHASRHCPSPVKIDAYQIYEIKAASQERKPRAAQAGSPPADPQFVH